MLNETNQRFMTAIIISLCSLYQMTHTEDARSLCLKHLGDTMCATVLIIMQYSSNLVIPGPKYITKSNAETKDRHEA